MVDRTIVQGDGVDDILTCSNNAYLGINMPMTSYAVGNLFSQTFNAISQNFSTSSNNQTRVVGRLASANNLVGFVRDDISTTSQSSSTQTMNIINCYIHKVGSGVNTVYVNAVQKSTQNTILTTSSLNSISVFSRGPFSNGQTTATTIIYSLAQDSDPRITLMNNYIKSINNNAF